MPVPASASLQRRPAALVGEGGEARAEVVARPASASASRPPTTASTREAVADAREQESRRRAADRAGRAEDGDGSRHAAPVQRRRAADGEQASADQDGDRPEPVEPVHDAAMAGDELARILRRRSGASGRIRRGRRAGCSDRGERPTSDDDRAEPSGGVQPERCAAPARRCPASVPASEPADEARTRSSWG